VAPDALEILPGKLAGDVLIDDFIDREVKLLRILRIRQ